jgi:hypothetical protein
MATKKTKPAKPANDSNLSSPFLSSAWQNLWELADDTRAEVHKQTGAVIVVVDGVLRGLTGYATNLNNRANRLTQEGLAAVSRAGRDLAVAGQGAALQVVTSSRSGANKVASTTRESARSVSERANATVRAIITPAKAA